MDFLDAVVLNGLQQTSFTSLKGMWYQLSEAPLVVSVVVICCESELVIAISERKFCF